MVTASRRLPALCLLGLAAAFFAAGCGTEENSLTRTPPHVASVAPDSGSAGDTIVISGTGFNETPSSNRIILAPGGFRNAACGSFCVPIAGSGTELRAVVPIDAFTGSIRVEDLDPIPGHSPLGIDPPPAPSNGVPFAVRLDQGEAGKVFFGGTAYSFDLEAEDQAESYLLVLFNSANPISAIQLYDYAVTAEGTAIAARDKDARSAAPPAPSGKRNAAPAGLASMGNAERDFKRRVREETRRILETAGPAKALGAGRTGPDARAALAGSGAPPILAQFDVLVDPTRSTASPSNYTVVTAELRYTGDHVLLYVDTTTCAECLLDEDVELLGAAFDDSIYQRDRGAFGTESDINHDTKVAILMTPAVNRMTQPGDSGYIAGYFLPNDLVPMLVDYRCTNAMEVFYTIVPDPNGSHSSNHFSREKTIPVIRSVLAHEFLHMILFNYRVLIYGKGYLATYLEDLWIEEGLAHIAEDLNGDNTSNIARVNRFFMDPGAVTLIHGGDALDERGAEYLFLRYLGDRYGEETFRFLVQTKNIGVRNVEAVTGAIFNELFADWSIACWLSGLGISTDERFAFTSIDLRADFNPIYTEGLELTGTTLVGNVRAMGPEFMRVNAPSGTRVSFGIMSEGKMNVLVVRLE